MANGSFHKFISSEEAAAGLSRPFAPSPPEYYDCPYPTDRDDAKRLKAVIKEAREKMPQPEKPKAKAALATSPPPTTTGSSLIFDGSQVIDSGWFNIAWPVGRAP